VSKKFKQIALWVLGFVVAFFCVKGIKSYYFEEVKLKNIESTLEKQMDNLNNPIVEEGKSKSKAVVDNAIASVQDRINNAKTDNEKTRNAIDLFRGFYLINAKARPKYCAQYGVNINIFVKAFEKEHVHEYAFMKNYDAQHEPLPEKFYDMLNNLLDKQVATEMTNTAKESNLSITDYCKTFEEFTKEYIEEVKLSKRMPEIYIIMRK
jgi:hypothetical protein